MAQQIISLSNTTVDLTSYLNGGGNSPLTGNNLTSALYRLNQFDGLVRANIAATIGTGANRISFSPLPADDSLPLGPTVQSLAVSGLAPSYFYDGSGRTTAFKFVLNGTTGQTFGVFGGSGNDTIGGGNVGSDILDGGAGDDIVSYEFATAAVSINLSTGAASGGTTDIISNFEGVIGGTGADTLTGTSGNNTLIGGAGNDTLIGGAGDDVIDGGLGTGDVVDFSGALNPAGDAPLASTDTGITLVLNGSTFATVTTGSTNVGADTIRNVEHVIGTGGADNITGDVNSNSIVGSAGNDTLSGGAGGRDTLVGGAGNDILDGGNDNDTFAVGGSDGTDTIFGGTGFDTIAISGTVVLSSTDTNITGVELITLGSGAKVTLTGQSEGFVITGSTGAETVLGGSGADTIDGGAGVDTVDYSLATGGGGISLTLNMSNFATVNPGASGAGSDIVRNVENVVGTSGNDTITGDQLANIIIGGNGDDTLDGGLGIDTYQAATSGSTAITVDLSSLLGGFVTVTGVGTDKIRNFENVTGNDGADTITGDALANVLSGGKGNDTLSGGDGSDTLLGGDGDDSVDGGNGNDSVSGGDGADIITGGAGMDTISGDGGNDTISGGNGADSIDGGAGNDSLIGGDGADTIDGGADTDTYVCGDGTTTGISVTLNTSTAVTVTITGGTGNDSIKNIENVTGTTGADTINGDAAANVLSGLDGNDSINGGAGNDTITGGVNADSVTAGEGADTVVIGAGQDVVILTETTAAVDSVQFSTAFASGNTNAATITGFANAAGTDTFDIGFNVANGTTAATAALAAIAPVTTADNGTATANDVIFLLSGASDQMAAGSTLANAVANAVTALTSGTDFSSASIATGDSLILVLDDGTNSFVFHYVADSTPATTAAADLELIGIINGVADAGTFATGDFI